MSKHTPEPWVIKKGDWSTKGTLITTGRRKKNKTVAIAEVDTEGFSTDFGSEQKANASRIVACINACAGLPIEQLKSFPLGGVLNGVAGLISQRDELLSAMATIEQLQWREGLRGLGRPTDFAEREAALRALGEARSIARQAIDKSKP